MRCPFIPAEVSPFLISGDKGRNWFSGARYWLRISRRSVFDLASLFQGHSALSPHTLKRNISLSVTSFYEDPKDRDKLILMRSLTLTICLEDMFFLPPRFDLRVERRLVNMGVEFSDDWDDKAFSYRMRRLREFFVCLEPLGMEPLRVGGDD
jgi:hypothetical protein